VAEKLHKLEYVAGVEGNSVYLNDIRIAGPKPWDDREPPSIINSCGCVFCDINFKPEKHDGQMMHFVRVSKGLRKKTPTAQWVPCTKPTE
jgi:hypothetical protein